MRTTELVAEAQKKVELFDQEINNVLKEIEMNKGDFVSSRIVAVSIMELSNIMDEIYKRIIKKITSRRVLSVNVIGHLEYCSINEQQIECLSKIKRFRNVIAHSLAIETPVLKYFKKETDRVAKVQNRMKLILENVKDDVDYAYVFKEYA